MKFNANAPIISFTFDHSSDMGVVLGRRQPNKPNACTDLKCV
jgi:hypothetical protein